jgi:hypothetical protein
MSAAGWRALAEAGSLRLMPDPSRSYTLAAFCAASNTSRVTASGGSPPNLSSAGGYWLADGTDVMRLSLNVAWGTSTAGAEGLINW